MSGYMKLLLDTSVWGSVEADQVTSGHDVIWSSD